MSSLALALSGCNCKEGGPAVLKPVYTPKPLSLSFSACPTQDENGAKVSDVFPDTQKLSISNESRARGGLALSLSGPGAANFDLGTQLPTAINGLEKVDIPISFSPTGQGDVRAELTIDDQTDGTDNAVVSLLGSGIALPARPFLETSPQQADLSFVECTADTPIFQCELNFPDTLMDQSNTLQLKIRNKGCPSLKVSELEIQGLSNPGTTDGFTIDSPAVLPSSTSPMILSAADGTDEIVITVRFSAAEDGTKASSQAHNAVLLIKSNDARPDIASAMGNPAVLQLRANAIKPNLYVSPSSCNFGNTQDTCGNTPREAHKATFRINNGDFPVLISSVRFKSSGALTSSNTRFSVTKNIAGQTLAAHATGTIEVTEVDQPLLVSDQLEVVADIPGMSAGSAGTVVAAVYSGIKPCLTTDPPDVVDFGDPQDELTTRTVKIQNGAGCGVLVVESVSTSTQPFFSVTAPLISPNAQVPAGGSVDTVVQYKRPASGGTQLADLKIVTNDTDYAPPQNKLLILQANAAFDARPIAVLTACSPAELASDATCATGHQASATYALNAIAPDEITLSAVNSSDDHQVTEYQFKMIPPIPPGASTSALANHGIKGTSPSTKLTIPSGVTGNYRFALDVFDNRGQQSLSSLITITVAP